MDSNQGINLLFENNSHDFWGSIKQFQQNFNQNQKKKWNRVSSKKWSIEENDAYISYLIENTFEIQDQKLRKKLKTFKKMSDSMQGVRSADQCQGHHKSMIEKYGNVQEIISGLTLRNQHLKRLRGSQNHTTLQKLDSNNSIPKTQVIEKQTKQNNFSTACLQNAQVQQSGICGQQIVEKNSN